MKNQPLADEYEFIEHSLQFVIWREQKKISQLLAEHELTLPQFLVLVSIHQHGSGCPMGELADETFQSNPTMTGIVDRLHNAGLVVRERATWGDRRQVVVNLTPAGRKLLERARNARRERLVRAFARFSPRDRREFVRLLTTYLEALEKESE
jgi:DNA-binding MarR family transcriptional regulator